jgi:hypothetical protein
MSLLIATYYSHNIASWGSKCTLLHFRAVCGAALADMTKPYAVNTSMLAYDCTSQFNAMHPVYFHAQDVLQFKHACFDSCINMMRCSTAFSKRGYYTTTHFHAVHYSARFKDGSIVCSPCLEAAMRVMERCNCSVKLLLLPIVCWRDRVYLST